jgi:phosphoglycerate dehydrogenase-like enzyme
VAKILVTPRSASAAGHPSLERLTAAGYEIVFAAPGRQPTEAELIAALPGCVGFLAGVEPISAEALEAAKDLKVISRNGTGVDAIDLAATERLGIRVCRAEGANAQGVAELTIATMFTLARSIPFSDAGIKAGGWQRRKGIELRGRTLGLVGCGKIGRLVARAALGLGMNVVAYDPYADTSFAPSDGFRFAAFDDLLEQSDVVSLHCPPPADGRAVIDVDALAKMRNGVLLINTARASLIDADAALAALESGKLAGLATDVFDTEPPSADDRLARHDRVIGTPHIGAFTSESIDRAMDAAVENLLACLSE